SYFVRPVSHSIRLAGNIMAGHAVIKVFAAFAAIAAIAPVSVVAITAMYGLEVLVALIQAYVFTILTCVYLKDALRPAHCAGLARPENEPPSQSLKPHEPGASGSTRTVPRCRSGSRRHGRCGHGGGQCCRQLSGGRPAQPVGCR